jgi:hypothetical protein
MHKNSQSQSPKNKKTFISLDEWTGGSPVGYKIAHENRKDWSGSWQEDPRIPIFCVAWRGGGERGQGVTPKRMPFLMAGMTQAKTSCQRKTPKSLKLSLFSSVFMVCLSWWIWREEGVFLYIWECKCECVGLWNCAGIFKQSMVARNRVGTGLSYRPAHQATHPGGTSSLESILWAP